MVLSYHLPGGVARLGLSRWELDYQLYIIVAKIHKVELAFIEPGKPAQNAYIERFNRTYREYVLDANLFPTLQEVRDITDEWIEEYNALRTHESLEGLPPYQYLVENV